MAWRHYVNTLYDKIGKNYSVGRKADPKIASHIFQYLQGAESIVNIGAGTGSYEPVGSNLVAVEPSVEMIKQRPKGAHPFKQATAESLPFDDGSFTHAMTVLSMHHWEEREAAFSEIKRVITNRFIAFTWNPDSERYWLTKDYFPEIHDLDQLSFPTLGELQRAFKGIKFYNFPISSDCIDGFTAAYWARPNAYLDPVVREGMSTFSKIKNVNSGVAKLKNDVNTGRWCSKNSELEHVDELDVGYIIAVWDM